MTLEQKQARIDKAKATLLAKKNAINKLGARTVIFNNQARFFGSNANHDVKMEIVKNGN